MKEIAEWLIGIEKTSNKFYCAAAAYFKNSDIAPFLERCALDEARHAELISTAIQVFEQHPEIQSPIRVDRQIKDAIEAPFRENQKRLQAKQLTRENLIDCLVDTELSEWNPIFLYVVNSLKSMAPEFRSAAAELQRHLSHVQRFVAGTEHGRQKIEKLNALQPGWQERILILEDDPDLAELFTSVLWAEGLVDAAPDGETGLEMIELHYYRLIVSDVDMPGMDGITLYRQAEDRFPGIGRRYLFLTGNPSPEIAGFFNRNRLRYLTKPASLRDLQAYALEILDQPAAD